MAFNEQNAPVYTPITAFYTPTAENPSIPVTDVNNWLNDLVTAGVTMFTDSGLILDISKVSSSMITLAKTWWGSAKFPVSFTCPEKEVTSITFNGVPVPQNSLVRDTNWNKGLTLTCWYSLETISKGSIEYVVTFNGNDIIRYRVSTPESVDLRGVEDKEFYNKLSLKEQELVDMLRLMVSDDDPRKNILTGQEQYYSNKKLYQFLKRGLWDINGDIPRTDFSMDDMPDKNLLVTAGQIFLLISEGVLHIRNEVQYQGSSLNLNMFGKSGEYQGAAAMLLNIYLQQRQAFKRGITMSKPGCGFVGIHSQFGRTGWRW